MDEKGSSSEAPGTGSNHEDRDRPSSADRLVARLAELRGQLEVLAPRDQERGREAIERIRHAQERVAVLEEMLAKAREREHDLTIHAVRDRTRIFEYEARISELSAVAGRVSAAEEARQLAESLAAEKDRASTVARAEVEAQRAEIDHLRSRNSELEADLASVGEELAAAAVARAEATRLETERNEARARAHTERRLAAEDRLRAVEAGLRATELQRQLRAAERRLVAMAEGNREQAEPAPEVRETVASPPPWIELQRASSEMDPVKEVEGSATSEATIALSEEEPSRASDSAAASEPGPRTPATSSDEKQRDAELIDLTAEERASHEDDGADRTSPPDKGGSTASAGEGIWQLLRGLRRS